MRTKPKNKNKNTKNIALARKLWHIKWRSFQSYVQRDSCIQHKLTNEIENSFSVKLLSHRQTPLILKALRYFFFLDNMNEYPTNLFHLSQFCQVNKYYSHSECWRVTFFFFFRLFWVGLCLYVLIFLWLSF